MDDFNEEAKGGYSRLETLTDPGRRRRWSDVDKSQIAAEALMPGAVVSQIERRWQICQQQAFTWRRAALRGAFTALVTPGPAFGAIVEGSLVAEPPVAKASSRTR